MRALARKVTDLWGEHRRDYRAQDRHRAFARDLSVLHDDPTCGIYLQDALGGTCIVSFTGIGHGTGGVDVQRPEFRKPSLAGPQIFILDKTRSWGNALDVPLIVARVRPVAQGRRVVTLGNSMGAFLAVLLSGPLGAGRCLGLSPQWSVDPRVVPEETRWRRYRNAIAAFHHPDLRAAFDPDCSYDLLFGDDPMEAAHAGHFPCLPSVRLHRVRGANHELAAHLKAKGCLQTVVSAGLSGQGVAKALADAGLTVVTQGAGL